MALRKRTKSNNKRSKKATSNNYDLIFENRDKARSLARKILRKWNVHLDGDDVESAVDLALCKAAQGFDPKEGAQFMTYFYYFLKGCLVQAISQNMKFHSEVSNSALGGSENNRDFIEEAAEPDERAQKEACPEYRTYKKQLNAIFSDALVELSDLERKVVIQVHVCEVKMASVARELGYSRGYLTEVRGKALRKMRKSLDKFDIAA